VLERPPNVSTPWGRPELSAPGLLWRGWRGPEPRVGSPAASLVLLKLRVRATIWLRKAGILLQAGFHGRRGLHQRALAGPNRTFQSRSVTPLPLPGALTELGASHSSEDPTEAGGNLTSRFPPPHSFLSSNSWRRNKRRAPVEITLGPRLFSF
jgi:hypothetical protein